MSNCLIKNKRCVQNAKYEHCSLFNSKLVNMYYMVNGGHSKANGPSVKRLVDADKVRGQ